MRNNYQDQTTSAHDKVLSTALRLFTSRGYFNTSMRDITRESSVSTGSVYHYFKDKEGVGAALYQEIVDRMACELEDICRVYTGTRDQCHAVISLLFRITREEPEVMTFMLYVKHREFLPDELPVCSSKPFEIMREIVRRGMERGEIEQRDVLVASSCLFGGAIRVITSYLDGILEKPLDSCLGDVWACSWRAVAAARD